MWVHLQSGDSISFANDTSEECCGVINSFLGTMPSGHLLVQTVYEDAISVSVIEPRHGHITKVGAKPVVSPSGRLFATGDEEGLFDNLVTIWALDTTGDWAREYYDTQGGYRFSMPSDLYWIDDSTLSYVHYDSDTSTAFVVLERRGGHWRHRRP